MFRFFHTILFSFLLLGSLSSLSLANDTPVMSTEDEKELSHLLSLLDKHTDIATKTKMNADYIPGMVTVLYGQDLEAKGKRNVMEALTLVPGLHLNIGADGTPSLISRGIGSPFISATSMILLDGISLNTTLFGFATGICNMPIEQVERIEIIRGPGAAVHGEFAYSGVINIITRDDDNKLFATIGRNNSYTSGAMARFNDESGNMHLSLNGSITQTDGESHFNGPDSFGNYGNSNEKRDSANIFSTLKYKDFSLNAHYVEEGAGDFYGIQPVPQDHNATDHTYKNIEAQHIFNTHKDLDIQLKVGWQVYTYELDKIRLSPPDTLVVITPLLSYTYPDGMMLSISSTEEKLSTSFETSWKGLDNHIILAGVSYHHIELTDVWQETNFDLATYAPAPWQKYSGDEIFVDKDSHRSLVSVVLQDTYKPTPEITVTTGLRGDHYNDAGKNLSPRLAGVWQPSNNHIFKAQAARSFRPPTFMELSGSETMLVGNPDIKPETIDTYELGYIHRQERRTAKVTLSYSQLRDLIVLEPMSIYDPNDPTYRYTNRAGANQTAIEIELEQQIVPTLKFDGNLSYARTRGVDCGSEVVGAVDWLFNAALLYQPAPWALLTCQYRYTGKQVRSENDPRNDLSVQDKVDLTFSYFSSYIEGMTLRFGVQNVFDEEILNPSSSALSYPNDFETQDRYWWAQCSFEF